MYSLKYTYHILLGGNVGDTCGIFLKSYKYFAKAGSIIAKSSIYKSEAWGTKPQRYYLNQIIEYHTNMGPFCMLNFLKKIEKQFHRKNKGQLLPRQLDLDIIFFESYVIDSKKLIIPHPRMHERLFVLIPLHEIAPQIVHPIIGSTIENLLTNTKNNCTHILSKVID